jgi:hypothetical protein
MGFFKRLIDTLTLSSDRPVRRLLAYYLLLAAATALLLYLVPVSDRVLFSGERLDEFTQAPQLLQDGLTSDQFQAPGVELPPRVELAVTTALIMFGTLALMLPVSWVYMSARNTRRHNQSIAQTLIILPIVVAGVVLIVRNSLALAFSLAGIVAAVRFRATLRDTRDVVFIFLAIGVGFSAGVQALTVGALLSVLFNFVLLFAWRYDFGRNALEPTAASQWAEPLSTLAGANGGDRVPDRDLMLALTPEKVEALADRFNRVRHILGTDPKKPRYNAILTVTTNRLTDAQQRVEHALTQATKRWKLDEVVSNDGKPSELSYLVRLRKSTTRDDLLTAVRASAADTIQAADVELSDTLAHAQDGET